MVSIAPEGLGHDLLELGFDLIDGLAGGESGAVADPEDVRVDSEGFGTEGGVEDDVGSLAADARKFLEKFPISRHLAAEALDQRARERDHIFGLSVEQTDAFDRASERFFAQIDHLRRCFDAFEQVAGSDVDACIGRLCRKHDRDQQLIDIAEFKLGRRRRIGLRKPAEEFEHLRAVQAFVPWEPITSRIE